MKINKKVLPAIILIVVIMIVGFGVQFFSFKDSAEEVAASEQTNEYTNEVMKCQADADSKKELSKECQEIMGQK